MRRHIQLLAACLLITVVPAAVIAQSEPNPFGMLKGIKTGNKNADNIFENLSKSADKKGGDASSKSGGTDSWDSSDSSTSGGLSPKQQSVMNSLNLSSDSVVKRCGQKIPYSVDWASFHGDESQYYVCSDFISGIGMACDHENVKPQVQKNISKAVCRNGSPRGVSLSGGTMTFTAPNESTSNNEYVNEQLQKHWR